MVDPKPESASIAKPVTVVKRNQNDCSIGEKTFRVSGKTKRALPNRTKTEDQDNIVGLSINFLKTLTIKRITNYSDNSLQQLKIMRNPQLVLIEAFVLKNEYPQVPS